MACQIEGPIVDSLYDMALIAWNNKLEPPLPAINSPAAAGGVDAVQDSNHENLLSSLGELIGTKVIIHPQKLAERQTHGSSRNLLAGLTSIESATHPVEGGGVGDLTRKNEEMSTVENPRRVQNPVGNENRGGDVATGSSNR